MSDEINYQNNPLHGLSLKNMLIELVDHYGFKILFAYLNINCFKSNPSVESSVKFLKKTEWARQKVEVFYLYEFKNLPRASSEQFALPPRDRIVPEDQSPGEPAELDFADAERLREKRAKKAAERNKEGGYQSRSSKPTPYSNNRSYGGSQVAHEPSTASSDSDAKPSADPWAKWK
ncbi:MAG: hypothetical protein ACI84K_001428 [Pseudohongiellaceae bacterium]|jgi:uncharacterized protein (DUF2132 family)